MDALLYKAAVAGDINIPRDRTYLLAKTTENNTALHISARFGHVRFAEIIISACPDLLDETNDEKNTPLHVAARGGFLPLVKLLSCRYLWRQAPADDVEQGPSVSPLGRTNNGGNTALHEALKNRHQSVADHLLNADPLLSSVDNTDRESPLYLAALAGFPGIVRSILRQEPFSLHGPEWKTPLHAASIGGHTNIVNLLLEKFPHLIKDMDLYGSTALHYAVTRNEEITRILLFKDPTLAYMTDCQQLTPLAIATRCGKREMVSIILGQCPGCIEQHNYLGWTAFHIAATRHSMLERLLKRPESKGLINQADEEGNTPLHLAIRDGYYTNAEILMGIEGIDLNAKNNAGDTARDLCEKAKDVSFGKRGIWETLCSRKAARGKDDRAYAEEPLVDQFTTEAGDLKAFANTLSVVATLLATVSCAAAFTVPGGYKSDGPQEGLAVLARKAAFKAFMVSDTLTMCSSLSASVAVNWAMWGDRALLMDVFDWCCSLVYISLLGVSISFATGTFVVLSRVDLSLAIAVCIIACMAPLAPFYFFNLATGRRLPFKFPTKRVFGPYKSSQHQGEAGLVQASQSQI
ncbi:hypothetical protein Taro_049666 [Colocasia esculenta]|uniref:PGG domain-containing protein n=1 Tax=Colocasia esculenta TaxID=4460 RepID=A0A843XBH2_COLES|nr:hypothetical protein [Colocasia esculenta]